MLPGSRPESSPDQPVMGSMRLGSQTLAFAPAFATSFGAPVAAVSHAICNATESRFFILFFSL